MSPLVLTGSKRCEMWEEEEKEAEEEGKEDEVEVWLDGFVLLEFVLSLFWSDTELFLLNSFLLLFPFISASIPISPSPLYVPMLFNAVINNFNQVCKSAGS